VTEPLKLLDKEISYIAIEDAIYLHEIDLFDDFDGVSSAEVSFAAAGLDVESLTSALAFYQNAAIGALLVQPAEDQAVQPSEQEVKNFGDLLRRVAKGVLNTGRNVVTPHRWDVQNLQERFADMNLKDHRDIADDATFRAFDVPIEMVKAAAANYAEAYVVIHNWVQNRFIPRCHWYAAEITEQLVHEYYPDYTVEPNFDHVPAQKDDLARRVEITNAKLAGGYIDLYTAALAVDEKPDPALRGLYKVGTTVVPLADLPVLWQKQQASTPFGGSSGGSSSTGGGGLMPAKLPRESATATQGLSNKYQALGYQEALPPEVMQPTAMKSLAPNSVTSDVWLPDDQYKEWQNWRRIIDRKGRDYPFAAKSLPCDSVEFGRKLLAHGFELDEAFTAIKAHAILAAKSMSAGSGASGGFVTKVEPAKTADPIYATPEQYQRYWNRYDALKDEIRSDWLNDYMKVAGPEIVAHYSKLGHEITPQEVLNILARHHDKLMADWIGTSDKPGPLLAIALAGFAAGNDTLDTGKRTLPVATKAFTIPVDWSLINREALDFIKDYAFNLIKGIDQTTADNVRDTITTSLEGGLSRDQIAKALAGVFNDPARAKLIAQSEGIRVFNNGAFTRWTNAGVSKARWLTNRDGDVCPICRRLNGQVANINEGWTDPETGKVYRDMAHPGCRCPRAPEMD
ncbi:MAG TPA: phage portal protein, partial [Aggregatilineales bacterium]|nr:phage portal protein [Aggregatilineales bacterium]